MKDLKLLKKALDNPVQKDKKRPLSLSVKSSIFEELDLIAKDSGFCRNEVANMLLEFGLEKLRSSPR